MPLIPISGDDPSGWAAGPQWHDHGLVFTSQTGEPLDGANVRRAFRSITTRAGLGTNWTPRELRHSFVSIMSDNGVSIETIADLVECLRAAWLHGGGILHGNLATRTLTFKSPPGGPGRTPSG